MQKALVIGIAIVIFITGVLMWKSMQSVHVDTLIATTTSPNIGVQTQAPRQIQEGWREYRSLAYHFSILYPADLTAQEYAEEGGGATITFQNPEKGEGFQIFIVPYGETKVSDARFKADIPSGVRTDMRDATIDGATGAAFYSTDAALGDTREIWFIHGGYLYEVTTLKSLDQWLQGIMQTWRFG